MSNAPEQPVVSSLNSPGPDLTADGSSPAEPCRPCGAGGRLRKFFLLVVLLAVGFVEVKELRSLGAAQAAFDRLNRAFGKDKQLQPLMPAEVRQVIGRDPDETDHHRGLEVYRWTAGLKPHAVFVQYSLPNGRLYVRDIALDEDPRQ